MALPRSGERSRGGNPWRTVGLTAEALELSLPEAFERRARAYLEELRRWDRVGRLTGYRTESEQIAHLIVDTLLLLAILPAAASPLLDLGSGAGVPGLILKLARPQWSVTLVEASRRRANFLRQVIRQLGLSRTDVAHTRAEALAAEPGYQQAFRTVTARAVGPLGTVTRLAAPFQAPDGQLVVALGPAATPTMGTVRTVEAPRAVGLSGPRRFLIIPGGSGAGMGAGPIVPRGTRRARGAGARGGEPEGRGRQDHHRDEPRRRAGRR